MRHHTDGAAWGCDTHVHVIGDATQYPMVSDRHYTPGPASISALQHHLKAQALDRVVLVQPSVYGTDNQCLLDALSVLGPHARGVAVLDTSITTSALQQLDRCGIRGIRLNFESSANHNTQHLQSGLLDWSSRIADLGWHLQVYAPFAMIAASAHTIRTLAVPVVLDHFALWPHTEEAMPSDAHKVLELLNDKHIYIKLSASYRQPNTDPQHVQQLAHRLLQVQPECLLWGSDWPHTYRQPGVSPHAVSPYRTVASHQLSDERLQWLTTPALEHQVLVTNPAKLYRF